MYFQRLFNLCLILFTFGCAHNVFSKKKGDEDRPKALTRILRRYDELSSGPEYDILSAAKLKTFSVGGGENRRFSIHLINCDRPEAYAFKSYEVVVTKGLVQLVDSEEQLAILLLHEYAHVKNGHTDEHRLLSNIGSNIDERLNNIPVWAILDVSVILARYVPDLLHLYNTSILSSRQELEADVDALKASKELKIHQACGDSPRPEACHSMALAPESFSDGRPTSTPRAR